MQIVTKPVAELTPAPYNPRKVLCASDSPYRKLKQSLERFGLVEPLIWNASTGHLVSGHQRLSILKELQSEVVQVVVVQLTEVEEKALNIVLNNREAQGDWNVELLEKVLTELQATSPETAIATGFDAEQIAELHADLEPVESTWQADDTLADYEITFRLSAERFELLRPALDAFVQEHELEVHIRQPRGTTSTPTSVL